MANVLTGIRIICGIMILYFPTFSVGYYFVYLLGAFTDAIDGMVARKTGNASEFGAKFDTIADFVFAISVMFTIIKNLYIPLWIIIWIVIIAVIKIGSHLIGYLKYHRLKTIHSVLNKVCGGVIFVVPLVIGSDYPWQLKLVIWICLCIFASIVSIVEAVTILKKQEN